jgi:hypothetical protein
VAPTQVHGSLSGMQAILYRPMFRRYDSFNPVSAALRGPLELTSGETYAILLPQKEHPERVKAFPSAQPILCMHNRTPYEPKRAFPPAFAPLRIFDIFGPSTSFYERANVGDFVACKSVLMLDTSVFGALL